MTPRSQGAGAMNFIREKGVKTVSVSQEESVWMTAQRPSHPAGKDLIT